MKIMMEGLEYTGEDVWVLVTEIRQGVVGAFFSSVVPGIEAFPKNGPSIQ